MRISQGDGIRISNLILGYELWLSGNTDYAIIEYEDVSDHKGKSDYHTLWLRGPIRSFARLWWI